jgi:CRP/FNR family cyclic AMP-dependent transcriptional regulator
MRISQLNSGKRKPAALSLGKPAANVLHLHRAPYAKGDSPVVDRVLDTNHVPLRQKDLFEKLSPHERTQVLAKCSEHHIKSGTLLYTQGMRHIDTYIVKQGLIRTYYSSPMGREIALAYWSNGDLLGGPNFFDEEGLHLWSAQAVEDCTVLAIKGHDFRYVAAHIPALAEQVFDALCFKMRWFSLLVQTLGTESVSSRLANLLLILSEVYGIKTDEGIAIKYCFSQEDLAHMVGATRQWVSVALGHLQKGGVVRMRKRRLVVLNIDSLRSLIK